jgi:hypothetical protein
MKVIPLNGAKAPKHLYATTPDGRREPIVRLVIAPSVFGSWSLIAHFETPARPGLAQRLEQASLRTIILMAEQLTSQYPEIQLDTGYLSPEGIRGFQIEDVWCGEWATGKRREPADFANAQALYLHLRQGYYNDGACWVREDGERRIRLYRDSWSPASMTAWEIAEYRMAHPGAEVHPTLEVPEDTCPRCLSRHVAIPDHGVGYRCLECHHEPAH